eukprot:13702235-Heterocapsa_arctica.AAC.1
MSQRPSRCCLRRHRGSWAAWSLVHERTATGGPRRTRRSRAAQTCSLASNLGRFIAKCCSSS